MPRKTEHGILAIHAGTVVGDADQRPTAFLDGDVDRGGTSIERILHQLLDDRRGSLHDFTGRDLIGDGTGENGDTRHTTTYRTTAGDTSGTARPVGSHPRRPSACSTRSQPSPIS